MDVSPLASAGSDPSLGLDLRSLPEKPPAEQRRVVAGQFEAIMLRQLLSQSVGSMLGGDDSTAGSVYGYLLTDTLAQKLSAEGGIGLSNIIAQQLAPPGQPAAKPAEKGSS